MNGHLSDLALDVLAPDFPRAAPPHLAECARCRHRLDAFREARVRTLASPELEATFARVAGHRPRRHVPAWLGLALAAAVALALLAVPRVEPARLKGGPSLELVPLGGARGPTFHPGDRVALAVGGAGHRYALVVGEGAGQPPQILWPQAAHSGAIPPGASERLEPAFEVTPGSLHLIAIFSDTPLDANEVLSRWNQTGAPAPPRIPGESVRAQAELRVEVR